MAKKPTLADVTNMNTAATVINDNNDLIETAFDNTLSRDGSTPNQMESDIDLNSNDLINVRNVEAEDVLINGTSVTAGIVASQEAAAASAEEASTSADESAASALQSYGYAQEASLYDGPKVDTFAELESVTPTMLAVGGLIRCIELPDQVFRRVESGEDFDYTGTGGVKLTVVLNGLPNIKAFGAVGDGVTDDSPAMQKAINATGGGVFLPEGTYRFATQITLPVYNFYDDTPGRWITGSNAQILVDTPADVPLFTSDQSVTATSYTSKWWFTHISFLATGADKVVFDMDRIYNSIFSHGVYEGFKSVFRSNTDRSGNANYPDGYIQSAYINNNHFSQNTLVVDSKRAFNLDVSTNFFEGNNKCINVSGTADPAVNGLRICDNVLEGGGSTPIAIGAIFGGVISGNYFEANQGPSRDIDLAVPGAAFHRGLEISGNTFQPTATQKAAPGYYCIHIAQTLTAGRGPSITGNSTSGPRFITGLPPGNGFVAANYENGSDLINNFPDRSQVFTAFSGITTGLVNNRATAYSAGTWKVINILCARDGIFEMDGILNLYNIGGSPLGKTAVSHKFAVYKDVLGVWRGETLSLSVTDLSGARDGSGGTYYTSYWGAAAATYTFSGDTLTVSYNTFNDYSTPGPGTVYSLGPNLAVKFNQGTTNFKYATLSMP